MKLLNNYLQKQCLKITAVVLFLLLLLMVGTLFTATLRTVARGLLPPELLFMELALRSVDVLTLLVPLAFFLGLLFALSQMYRNQELVIMHGAGVSTARIVRALLPLALLLTVLMTGLSLWLNPAAARLSAELINQSNQKVSLLGLTEGSFQPFYTDEGVIYVGHIDTVNKRVENVFVNLNHPDRIDTLTAEYGYQFEENGRRYVALFNGYRNEGVPGGRAYRVVKFERNDILLPDVGDRLVELTEQSRPSVELLHSDVLADRVQLHWRLVPVFSVLVLFVLAVALSKTSHREGKYVNLMVGLMVYTAFVNLLTIGRSMLDQAQLPLGLGLWWVYVLFGLFAWWRIRRLDGARPRRIVGSTA